MKWLREQKKIIRFIESSNRFYKYNGQLAAKSLRLKNYERRSTNIIGATYKYPIRLVEGIF